MNPVSKLDDLAEEKTRSRGLTPVEQDALLRCLRPEHFAIVLFAILTGLSRDEQFSLKWSEVDFALFLRRTAFFTSRTVWLIGQPYVSSSENGWMP